MGVLLVILKGMRRKEESLSGEGGGAGGKKVHLCSEKGLGWKGGDDGCMFL